MVMAYGMSDALGSRVYGTFEDEARYGGIDASQYGNVSAKIAEEIDREIKKLVDDAKETARKTIKDNHAYMQKIVAILLEKETIEKEEFEAIFKDHASAPKKGKKA